MEVGLSCMRVYKLQFVSITKRINENCIQDSLIHLNCEQIVELIGYSQH